MSLQLSQIKTKMQLNFRSFICPFPPIDTGIFFQKVCFPKLPIKMPRLLATGYVNKPFYVCVFKWSNQITVEPEPELSFLGDVKTQHLCSALCRASFVTFCGNSSCLECPVLPGTGAHLTVRGAVCMDVHSLENHTAVSLADTRKTAFSGERNRVLFFVSRYDLVRVQSYRVKDKQYITLLCPSPEQLLVTL